VRTAPILQLQGVSKVFGGLPAVDGVDLAVDEGSIQAVIGPNGAGKSTLLKAISGLQPPTSGSVRFRGEDITGLPPHRVRHKGIAKVLQTPRIFPTMTVRENAALGAMFGGTRGRQKERVALAAADEALDVVGLGDRASDDVGQLNLHQQRILEVARALAGRPSMLLLDEVMAGLNPTELAEAIRVVRKVRDELGVTVVWVEHVMKAVTTLADRVFVLNFGQRLAEGTPEVVMRDPQVIEAYLGRGALRADAQEPA
jgi:ABC-type branched-subunit amino acid transport system ATPase component